MQIRTGKICFPQDAFFEFSALHLPFMKGSQLQVAASERDLKKKFLAIFKANAEYFTTFKRDRLQRYFVEFGVGQVAVNESAISEEAVGKVGPEKATIYEDTVVIIPW